ncbi:hypothetical protein SUGI_0939100 [Cryptomeria japonica]|nr:hypothetical protein SUGI_0939100 [Cryptomeria japonica]
MELYDHEMDQFSSDFMQDNMEIIMQMNGEFDNTFCVDPYPKTVSSMVSMARPVMIKDDDDLSRLYSKFIVPDHDHPVVYNESSSFVTMREGTDHRSGECIADNREYHNNGSSSYQFHEDLKHKESQNQMGIPLTQHHFSNVVNSTSQNSCNKELVKESKEPNSQYFKTSSSAQDQEVDFPKDFVHLRARRGQTTKKQSIYERKRREKIRERMKRLQDLVPDCKLVSGDIKRLDMIICYIQSLQRQVQSLSMKLQMASMITDLHFENLGHPFRKEGSCQEDYMCLLPS